jgi:hypothetical protein
VGPGEAFGASHFSFWKRGWFVLSPVGDVRTGSVDDGYDGALEKWGGCV